MRAAERGRGPPGGQRHLPQLPARALNYLVATPVALASPGASVTLYVAITVFTGGELGVRAGRPGYGHLAILRNV